MKRLGVTVFSTVVFCFMLFETSVASAQTRLAADRPIEHVAPSREEMASIGCITFGAAAALATGAAGIIVLAFSGGGAASYANLALPVLGTAFAAGCGVGVLAAPGGAWLFDHLPHVIEGRPTVN